MLKILTKIQALVATNFKIALKFTKKTHNIYNKIQPSQRKETFVVAAHTPLYFPYICVTCVM